MLENAIRRGCTDYRSYDYFDDLFTFVNVKEVTAKKKEPGSSLYHLTYKLKDAEKTVAGDVPIVVDRLVDPETVEGMVQEQVEEYLTGRREPTQTSPLPSSLPSRHDVSK